MIQDKLCSIWNHIHSPQTEALRLIDPRGLLLDGVHGAWLL